MELILEGIFGIVYNFDNKICHRANQQQMPSNIMQNMRNSNMNAIKRKWWETEATVFDYIHTAAQQEHVITCFIFYFFCFF